MSYDVFFATVCHLKLNKMRRKQNRVNVSQPVERQCFQASTHGITNEQRTGQHGGGTEYAEHDGSVDPPVVPKGAQEYGEEHAGDYTISEP